MSFWNGLEPWLPIAGEQPDPERSFAPVEVDGIEVKVKAYYTPCSDCIRRARSGESYDTNLMILCRGVGHLMVAANHPLCEEPPR